MLIAAFSVRSHKNVVIVIEIIIIINKIAD